MSADGAAPSTAGRISLVLDALIERFGGEAYAAEAAAARAEYDERRGRVFEDEELWDRWSQMFLEWYVLERVPDGDAYPLAARALADEPDPARRQIIRALITSHRSLFEVRQTGRGNVVLGDMIGGAAFGVTEQRALHGVEIGDVVEARLVGSAGAVSFAGTLCFHPPGTRDFILGHVERLRQQGMGRRDIIDFIAGVRVRCDRYKNVPPEKVYERPELRP